MDKLLPIFGLCLLTGFGSFFNSVEGSEVDDLSVGFNSGHPSSPVRMNPFYASAAIRANPSISLLLSLTGPYAIAGEVTEVIVGSFDTLPNRARPHISIEVLKLMPSIADSDTSAAITGEGWVVGVGASLHYTFPRFVFSGAMHAMSGAGVYNTFSHVVTSYNNVIGVGSVGALSAHYKQKEGIV